MTIADIPSPAPEATTVLEASCGKCKALGCLGNAGYRREENTTKHFSWLMRTQRDNRWKAKTGQSRRWTEQSGFGGQKALMRWFLPKPLPMSSLGGFDRWTENFCVIISYSLWEPREEWESGNLLKPGKVPENVKCPLEGPITSNMGDFDCWITGS